MQDGAQAHPQTVHDGESVWNDQGGGKKNCRYSECPKPQLPARIYGPKANEDKESRHYQTKGTVGRGNWRRIV